MAITAYKVLVQNSSSSLDSLVAAALAEGWQPQGGPVNSDNKLCQAVVKGTADGGGEIPAVEITAEDITDASAVGRSVLTALNEAAARAAIGAGTGNGTSNLVIGTAATQAKAGNYTPSTAEVAAALKAKAQLVAVTAIATPASADAPAVATKLNELLAALKA